MTTMSAPAKLTLSLRVVGTRPDGFHLIEAEMVTLDLCDELTFREGTDLQISVEGPALGGLPVTNDPNNLITRALAMVERTASVALIKRIPAGGGLGGGSADAAAVFRWAGRTSEEDVVSASRLGADVRLHQRWPCARDRYWRDHHPGSVCIGHLHVAHAALWCVNACRVSDVGPTRGTDRSRAKRPDFGSHCGGAPSGVLEGPTRRRNWPNTDSGRKRVDVVCARVVSRRAASCGEHDSFVRPGVRDQV